MKDLRNGDGQGDIGNNRLMETVGQQNPWEENLTPLDQSLFWISKNGSFI